MSNVQLRYYKKPRNKFNKKLFILITFLKKKFFLVGLVLIGVIAMLTFIALPMITTPAKSNVRINDDKESYTQLVSNDAPFYAEIDGKVIIANKIDKSYYANIGKIEKQTKVAVGPYQNFLIFQKTLKSTSSITVNPKTSVNSNFKFNVKEEQTTNIFNYEIEVLNDASEYTIYEGDVIIYQNALADSKCTKKRDTKTVFECKSTFGDSSKKVLDIKIKDKNNQIYEVITNKVITLNGASKITCTFPKEPKAGNNPVLCTSPVAVDIFVGDQPYRIEAGKEKELNIDGKVGKNQFVIIGTDANKQKIEQVIPFEVSSSFYFELSAGKNQYDISNPTNLEFIINTNEQLTLDITANAKDSTKGYESYNSTPIDTNFNQVNYINKEVKLESTNNSFVFQIDTTSNNNTAKKLVYAPIINVDFNIKSNSGKLLTANCKMYIKVNDKILDKSICTIKNIN